MNRFLKTFLSISTLSLVACNGETVDYTKQEEKPEINTEIPEVAPPIMASAPLNTISHEDVENLNEFALKFYLANSEMTHSNVCVSPFSVGSVLGMIANGSNGIGRNEILTLLGFDASEKGMTTLNTHYQTLLSNLPNIEEDITCNFTNTVWFDPSCYSITNPFKQTITDHYYANEIGISPRGETGREAINQFVSKNTNGLIDRFLSEPLQINMAFLNTSYFKAGWSDGFSKELTTKDIFNDIDYKEQKTDFMSQQGYLQYAQTNDGTEAVRLFYGNTRQLSMTLILPTTNINHVALDEVITSDNLLQINKNLKYEALILKLPKFEVELNNANTLEILRKIGLEEVCTGKALFNMIVENSSFILKCFVHAAKIKVDEDGTEGAAASLGELIVSAGPGGDDTYKPREIVFNRPFIFYIQENTTGSILFIGSVKTFS